MEHPLHIFKYCPKCGSSHFVENNEKSKRCDPLRLAACAPPAPATVAIMRNMRCDPSGCPRAYYPSTGTLAFPGGFIGSFETGEAGVTREVLEETGLKVERATYQFSLPNIYPFCGFEVHTLDLFYVCEVDDTDYVSAQDDAQEAFFLPIEQINPNEFGLASVRKGLMRFLKEL